MAFQCVSYLPICGCQFLWPICGIFKTHHLFYFCLYMHKLHKTIYITLFLQKSYRPHKKNLLIYIFLRLQMLHRQLIINTKFIALQFAHCCCIQNIISVVAERSEGHIWDLHLSTIITVHLKVLIVSKIVILDNKHTCGAKLK